MPRWLRLLVLAPIALSLGACGDDDDSLDESATSTSAEVTTTTSGSQPTSSTTTTEPSGTLIEITVANGDVEGGVRTHEVDVGDEVTLRVTADVADEVHVHGYDLTADVEPGTTAEIRFTADLPGVFEVELEERGLPIAELQIS
jgi:hypothetical protein